MLMHLFRSGMEMIINLGKRYIAYISHDIHTVLKGAHLVPTISLSPIDSLASILVIKKNEMWPYCIKKDVTKTSERVFVKVANSKNQIAAQTWMFPLLLHASLASFLHHLLQRKKSLSASSNVPSDGIK